MIDSNAITDSGAKEMALGILIFNIKEYKKHMKYIQNHPDSPERRRRRAQIREIERFFRSKYCARYLEALNTTLTGDKILSHLKSEFTQEESKND